MVSPLSLQHTLTLRVSVCRPLPSNGRAWLPQLFLSARPRPSLSLPIMPGSLAVNFSPGSPLIINSTSSSSLRVCNDHIDLKFLMPHSNIWQHPLLFKLFPLITKLQLLVWGQLVLCLAISYTSSPAMVAQLWPLSRRRGPYGATIHLPHSGT